MQELYEDFLIEPSTANYLRVRAQLLQSEFPPTASDLVTLEMFCKAEAWDRAPRWAAEISDDFLICPRFHYWRAAIAKATNDQEGHELSVFEMQSCLAAIIESGDGSQAQPYLTLYPSDVQDILVALSRTGNAQHTVQRPDGTFDIVSCDDNTEIWFHQPLLDHVAAPLPTKTL